LLLPNGRTEALVKPGDHLFSTISSKKGAVNIEDRAKKSAKYLPADREYVISNRLRGVRGAGSTRRTKMAEVELPNLEELEKLKNRVFERRVALTMAIFAVMLAIAGLGGNNATKEMLLAQQQASDQWAFYQSKSIKEHQSRLRRTEIEFALVERGGNMTPEVRKQAETLLGKIKEEEQRYQSEKAEIEKEAKELEHERDLNREKDPYFDFAEVLLQIAIVMASISILADMPPIFYFSLMLASTGTFLALNGYLMFLKIPFLRGGH
jgi:hypothetical protein